jgi:hypothetical protein
MEDQMNMLVRAERARHLADVVLSQSVRETLLALEREFRQQATSPPPDERMM